MVRYGTGQIRDSARRDTDKHQTRELGSSGPYAMLLCFFAWVIVHVIRTDGNVFFSLIGHIIV